MVKRTPQELALALGKYRVEREPVTRAQLQLALVDAGEIGRANAFFRRGGSPAQQRSQVAWDESPGFRRNDVTIQDLQGALGYTDDEMDALFLAAQSE